jgi:hypothetical protein
LTPREEPVTTTTTCERRTMLLATDQVVRVLAFHCVATSSDRSVATGCTLLDTTASASLRLTSSLSIALYMYDTLFNDTVSHRSI